MSESEIYDEYIWYNRMFGLQETATGRWKFKFLLRVSFFRERTLILDKFRVRQEHYIYLPIESSTDLRNPLFATERTMIRMLYDKWNPRVVATVYCDTFPATALRPCVFEFGHKLLYLYETLTVILVLQLRWVLNSCWVECSHTSVYCPGTSNSSTLLYWNSVR